MSRSESRRVRVEQNIFKRTNATGRAVFEVGYRDSEGRQRWKTVTGGIRAARVVRDDLLARRGRGERVTPNPRLRFNEAADAWLQRQVADLKPATRAGYRNSVEKHLRSRWGRMRLDAITVDDAARLVRELKAEGKSEWTIVGILKAANRIFRFAKRRLGWQGENPIAALESSERPQPGTGKRRRIYQGDELAQTLAAAKGAYRVLFALAAVTGARISECLGLVWGDLSIEDLSVAEIRFEFQVDRQGQRQALKTEESRRTVEIPPQLAALLNQHFLSSGHQESGDFVFSTKTGTAIGQRNVGRELRKAQQAAVDSSGKPTFPILQIRDEEGNFVKPPRGSVPTFHCFRHSVASEAIAQGDSAEEVAFQLGHRDSTVTRSVYVQEIKSAERTARRRAKMEERYGDVLEEAAAPAGTTNVGPGSEA